MTPSLAALAMLAVTASPWPTVDATPAGAPSGTGAQDAAVIAGVSRPFVLPPLSGAAENATSWFTWLTRVRGVPLEHAHLLRDGEATRERLLAAADKARTEVGPGGTLWIVFIGYGAPAPAGDDGLLVGADAQPTELSLLERSVAQSQLLSAARGAQRATVAIFDAAFSGAAADGVAPLVPGSQATLPLRTAAPAAGTVLLSSSDARTGPLPGHDRPAFSYLLLGALRGWGDGNGDGRVTAAEAVAYAQHALVVAAPDRPQPPSVSGAPLDVVLSDDARERGPDLLAVVNSVRSVAPPPSPGTVPIVPPPPSAREQAFREREIYLSFDRKWLRRDRPEPLARQDLIDAGRPLAPDAARLVEDITSRQARLGNPLVWVLPPVAGGLVGAAGGIAIGAAVPSTHQGLAYAIAVPVGTVLLAGIGTLAVSMPIGLSGLLSEDDKHRLDNAEHELADAINAAERNKLGLEPR
ncbi:MAG: hypothetical protein HYS27_01745 [Deltaproteobacteria bacterium]|nr:hypothetical protein [Deltaproteobacteria bacterium]